MRKILTILVLVSLGSGPVHAQIPVTDVASLAQIILIANKVRETYDLMREEYQTIQRISRGYAGNLLGYRIPAIPPLNHDVAKFQYAAALLEGLNSGDPRGERYNSVMRTVMRPGGLFAALPPDARKVMEATFAGIEIADSVATMGIHGSAQARGYSARIATLIEQLQNDVTAPGSEYHEVTAIADKLALASLISARQNQSSNQVESSILEQLLAKNTRTREAAAAHMNMTITAMRDNGDLSGSMVQNATSTLQNWRLP